ncbi:MAG: carboxymuconolactone decarboxylase family protein [Asticcacaulis sp.]
MTARLNYIQASPDTFKKYQAFSQAAHAGSIEASLFDLVQIRASQLNGCAFCVDMHVKEATIRGERALRLHHVAVWHDSPLFSDRERAALYWTETLTRLPEGGISDETYNKVAPYFSETEMTDLSFAIIVINGWNRLSVGFAAVPGSADAIYGLDKAGLS